MNTIQKCKYNLNTMQKIQIQFKYNAKMQIQFEDAITIETQLRNIPGNTIFLWDNKLQCKAVKIYNTIWGKHNYNTVQIQLQHIANTIAL